ncbi:tyrosine-type recombinase/integrase [Sphingomonas sp.]
MSSDPWRLGKLRRKRTDGSGYWSWCILWNDDDGSRRRVSLGTTDRIAAEKLARDFWSRLTLVSVDTVGQVVEAYLDGLLTKDAFLALNNADRMNRAAEHKDAHRKRTSWKAAKPYWGGLRLSQVDDQTSLAYIGWRKRAANTVRNELGLIRTALNWAAAKGSIPKPAPKIVLPAMPESRVTHLTKPEFARLLEKCVAPHVKLFAMLAVTTGARSTALLELTWDRVDFEQGLIHLNPQGRMQKANKQRATVPLSDRVKPVLQEARDGALTEYVIECGGKPVASIKKGIGAAATRAKVHATPHMFRHSAAVWMAEDRVPMEEIARFLGHTDTRITSRVYAKFSPDYLRRAARSLDW